MRPSSRVIAALLMCSGLFWASGAGALTLPANFAGSDGAFEPTTDITVDLGQAATGAWDQTPGTGSGVYDPAQWAVVFRFTTVDIPAGVTVTFANHPSRAPVIWLVNGDILIDGALSLDGEDGLDDSGPTSVAEPGPGGFRGGRGERTGSPPGGGMGPGGGSHPNQGAGSYGTLGQGPTGPTYGNIGVFPLIGGSGGAGRTNGAGGSGGGGAILLATEGVFTLNGIVSANAGIPGHVSFLYAGGGSGGGIRILADTLQGTGVLQANGGSRPGAGTGNEGGAGRIRVEANVITLQDTGSPVMSTALPAANPRIFREAGDGVPEILQVTVDGQPVPADPQSYPFTDVASVNFGTVPVEITARDVPAGSTVTVRVVRLSGEDTTFAAVFDGPGGPDETLWTADITTAGGFATVQVRAELP